MIKQIKQRLNEDISREELEKHFIDFLDSSGYIDKNGDRSYSYTIYADYRDELEPGDAKDILESSDPYGTFYDKFDSETWVYAESELRDEFEKYLKEKNIDFNEEDMIDVFELGLVSFDIDEKHYLGQDFECRIMVNAGDGLYDYSLNPSYYNDYKGEDGEGGPINTNSGLGWLAVQQGYTIEQLRAALSEGDIKDPSGFLQSVRQEAVNTSSNMNALIFLVKDSLKNLIDWKENKTDIVLPKSVECGIFDAWNGGGSVLEIELDKDVVIPVDKIGEFTIDVNDSGTYSVNDVYGINGEAYNTTPQYRNSQSVEEKLEQSSSKKALKKNIKKEIEAGKDPKQAAAIAYSVKRKNENLKEASDAISESDIYEALENIYKGSELGTLDKNTIYEVAKEYWGREISKRLVNQVYKDLQTDYSQYEDCTERKRPRQTNIRTFKSLKEATDEDPEIAELEARIQAIRDRKEKERLDKEESDRVSKEKELKDKLDNDPLIKQVLEIIKSDKSTQDKIQGVFDLLVPSSGSADSTAGELVRAIMKLIYRDYNDGDVFYEGYGIETCGSAISFIRDKINEYWPEMDFDGMLRNIAESQYVDDNYTDSLEDIADHILMLIAEKPELIIDDANEDMYDSDTSWLEELEPKYEEGFELPQEIMDHVEAGNIERIEWELEGWDEFRGADIEVQEDMVYLSNLTKEQYDDISSNWTSWMKNWSDDLDDEYGVPGESEEDEDMDESYSSELARKRLGLKDKEAEEEPSRLKSKLNKSRARKELKLDQEGSFKADNAFSRTFEEKKETRNRIADLKKKLKTEAIEIQKRLIEDEETSEISNEMKKQMLDRIEDFLGRDVEESELDDLYDLPNKNEAEREQLRELIDDYRLWASQNEENYFIVIHGPSEELVEIERFSTEEEARRFADEQPENDYVEIVKTFVTTDDSGEETIFTRGQ